MSEPVVTASSPTDTPLGLLKQALHLLALWSPKWTPEMEALSERVDALNAQVTAQLGGQPLSQARQEAIAYEFGELNDAREFARNGWACAGVSDVLAAIKKAIDEAAQVQELASLELRAKAARYDRLRALAERTALEPGGGFRIGDRLYATFEDGFDAEIQAELESLS